ncbi:MAG: ATP-binding cassette domain-containing protein [Chloroflexota bacterium]
MVTSSRPKAITVNGITKRYGQHIAVDNLSFDVYSGEIFSMLGPNGAGKTSTIRMILDIIKPDSGTLEVLGGPFVEATKQRIGYLPEERGLYKSVPLLELLIYLGTLKGMSTANASKRANLLLEEVGLGENKKSKVSELSRGMSQKVQFVATILHDPELLIIDEPFSGLDPVNTEMIKNIIYNLKARGRTIVMSIHEMHQVEEMADRLLMVNHGKRVLYGSVDEVRQQYAENAVTVSGQGDWQNLPGVQSVRPGEGGRSATLMLDDHTTPDQIMQALAANPDYHVRSFALAIPSLNDIFIRVAGDNGEFPQDSQGKEGSIEPAQNMANR